MKNKFGVFLFFAIISCQIQAQSFGQWTWMKGDSTYNTGGVYGTLGVAAPSNKPYGLYETYEWTDLNGNFWIFGGVRVGSYVTNSFWKFDPLINQWTWMGGSKLVEDNGYFGVLGIPSSSNIPSARGYGGVTWTDNSGDLWLFGGGGRDINGNLGTMNDLWRYNIASNQWTWMKGSNSLNAPNIVGTKGVGNLLNTPDGRHESNAGVVDKLGNLWLFGGYSKLNVKYNDVWKYNIASNMWSWESGDQNGNNPTVYGTLNVSSPTNNPGGRLTFTKFIDSQGNMYFMGIYVLDVWKYNPISAEWTWVGGSQGYSSGSYVSKCDPITFNRPKGKYEIRASWPDSCGVFIFGGIDENTNESYNDLWYYNIESNKFTWLSGTSIPENVGNYGTLNVTSPNNLPASRCGAVAFKDKQSNLWLFGGMTIKTIPERVKNDLWKFKIDPYCNKLCSNSGIKFDVFANFSISSICGNAPLTVSFTNTSISATTYTWNYGDGSPLEYTTNPTHTYTANGIYSVSLVVQGTGTNTSTIVKNSIIYIGNLPIASFVASTGDTICSNTNINFYNTSQDSIISNIWSFGDGQGVTTNNAIHQYLNNSGSFTVSLIVTDNHNCKDTISRKYIVLRAPNAYINSISNPCASQQTSFNTYSTFAVNYLWNFGDTQTSTITNPNHQYNTAGTYSLHLVALGSNGCKDSINRSIIIYPKPVAQFTMTTNHGCPGLTDNFTNTSLSMYSYYWNIQSSPYSYFNTLNVSWLYNTSGTYSVSLIVKDFNLCTDTAKGSVFITNLPMVTTNTSNANLCVGQTATLSAIGALTYTWSTGATTSAIVVNPTLTTTYTVSGTDNNSCVNFNTITQSVSTCTDLNSLTFNESLIHLYSNSNTGIFTLEINASTFTNANINVYSVDGKLVYKDIISGNGLISQTINLSDLASGIYYLRLESKDLVKTYKLLRE